MYHKKKEEGNKDMEETDGLCCDPKCRIQSCSVALSCQESQYMPVIAPLYKLNDKDILTDIASNIFQNTFTIHLRFNTGRKEFNDSGRSFGVGPKLRWPQ